MELSRRLDTKYFRDLSLVSLQPIQETQDLQVTQETQEPQDLQETQETQDLQVTQEPQDLQETQESQDLQETQESQDLQETQESQDLQETQESQERQGFEIGYCVRHIETIEEVIGRRRRTIHKSNIEYFPVAVFKDHNDAMEAFRNLRLEKFRD